MSAGDRSSSSLPSELRARVLAEVARAPAPTRREHRTRVMVLAAVGVVATTALFFATGGVLRGTRPLELVALTAGSGLLAAVVLTGIAAGPSRSMLGRPRSVLLVGAGLAAVALAVVACSIGMLWPDHASDTVGPSAHLACGGLTVVQGALPLVALLLPRRGSDPVHPAVTGAALGMAAGAWSVVMAYLRCPHAAVSHCVAAHVLPTLALTAAGALLGRTLLRIR